MSGVPLDWETKREKNVRLVEIKEWVDSHDPGALVIPFSGSLESQLQDLSEEEQQKHCTEHKTQSALSRIIKAGYAALLLEYFFTTGPDEVVHGPFGSACPPPAAGDKEPVHCACLICVTEVVCAKIDVAFPPTKGTKAPQAAGKIHTDFEKGFIMAEVMKFQDFKEEGSENAVKAAGKYRQRGRNYEDGDIIFFKFNTPNAQKKK
ncbi:Obg-like ATPase 1 [Dissostichus eleginoides]|uniref:Obg-like ATPase 1 n=1 Tax=Dissostichus eleginoides TaxID=100907 RepID=A0AAD9CN73_DISEL|nr:Obg-like ATPase 1 [Dissostichus eleginoides]